MKQAVFITILIFAFCFVAFAQANISSCPKIKIEAPGTVKEERDISFKVSASFEGEKGTANPKFDWIIVKGTEVIRKYNTEIIEVIAKYTGYDYQIVILAENLDKKCQNPAEERVVVLGDTWELPVYDEYEKTNWNEERARLDNTVFQIEKSKGLLLCIFFDFLPRTSSIKKRNRLKKVLDYLADVRGFDKRRILLALRESDREITRLEIRPKDFSPDSDTYLSIKGKDFDKLEKLFQSNTVNKKRKK